MPLQARIDLLFSSAPWVWGKVGPRPVGRGEFSLVDFKPTSAMPAGLKPMIVQCPATLDTASIRPLDCGLWTVRLMRMSVGVISFFP